MRSLLTVRGFFLVEHRDKFGKLLGIYRVPNGVVTVGANHILETEFNGGSQIATWYIGLVDNSGYTGWVVGDTMGSHTGWSESTVYAAGTRPEWTADAAASRAITNSTTVDFAINATATLKGIFITSNNTKGGTTGTLWAVATFSSNPAVGNGDTLKVTYTITIP